MARRKFIAIAGNIGAGKTELTHFLCKKYKLTPFFEPNDEHNERRAELSAHPSWSFHGPRPDGLGAWPSWREVFEQYERRVARHRGTTFVGAHFGAGVICTLGSDDADAAKAVGQMGASHQACEVSDIVVDKQHRLVTTPAYMLAQSISEAASGIYKLVDRVLEMTTED